MQIFSESLFVNLDFPINQSKSNLHVFEFKFIGLIQNPSDFYALVYPIFSFHTTNF
jgi:hypothetical protein